MESLESILQKARNQLEDGRLQNAVTEFARAVMTLEAAGEDPRKNPQINQLATAIKTLHKIDIWATKNPLAKTAIAAQEAELKELTEKTRKIFLKNLGG